MHFREERGLSQNRIRIPCPVSLSDLVESKQQTHLSRFLNLTKVILMRHYNLKFLIVDLRQQEIVEVM